MQRFFRLSTGALEERRPLLEERRPLLEEYRPLLEERFPSLAGRKPGRLFYVPFVHAKISLPDFLPGKRGKLKNLLKEYKKSMDGW
ncbi:MAG: hypothetical protein LBJ60_08590, partial [Tannerellaceae bacterium]|nr:hypothetical protein [Tannerellaceae bacterium]